MPHLYVDARWRSPSGSEHGSADHHAQARLAAALQLRKAVGFRNIAVHSYSSIDWAVVHTIATRHLGDFEDFARRMDQHQG